MTRCLGARSARAVAGKIGRALGVAAVAGLVAPVALAGGKTVQHWVKYEAALTSMGKLRTERDPADVPFSNADLVRDFRDIMLHRENGVKLDGEFVTDHAPRRLKKLPHVVPIRIFGTEIGAADRAELDDYFDRLEDVTGVSLVESDDDPIIRLMFLDDSERQALAKWAATNPRWHFIARNVANDLGNAVCATYYSRDHSMPGRYDYIIVIPAEVGGIVRQSCIEEEIGQAFGPGADSDTAQPSIFNDDQDFALLTTHDEYLLRILYDPRIKAGMTADEAMPLVREIVEELRPGK